MRPARTGPSWPRNNPTLRNRRVIRRAIDRQDMGKVAARRRDFRRQRTLARMRALLDLRQHLSQHSLKQDGWQPLQTSAERRLE